MKPYFKYYGKFVGDFPSMEYFCSFIDYEIWHDEDTAYFYAVSPGGVVLGVDLSFKRMV